MRGIIDGHIMLTRKIAMRNHYPAIDVLASVSRLMNDIVEPGHRDAAARLRNMMATYQDNQDLISIGAYKSGSNPELDVAIAHMPGIDGFLQQSVDHKVDYEQTVRQLAEVVQ